MYFEDSIRMDRFEKMRADSRAKILRATLKLFAENGFAGTSVSDIARSAGMAKGAIYHYFNSKDELLEAVFKDVSKPMFSFYDEIKTNLPARERLSNFLHAFYQSLLTYRKHWLLLTNLMLLKEKEKMIQDLYRPFVLDFHLALRKVFMDFRGLNVNLEISYLLSLLNGWQVTFITQENAELPTQMAHYLERIDK